jgi:HAD superfamily 5'-nucleotidase-like hydrolase
MRSFLLVAAAGIPAVCAAVGYRALRARSRLSHVCASLPRDVRVVMFDLDHTLARYELPALFALVHECCARFLVHEKGYERELLRPYDREWPALKGLIFDFETGDLILLDAQGSVARARHGALPGGVLDAQMIAARYGGEGHRWREADRVDKGSTRAPSYFAMTTGFDVGLSLLCAQLVDQCDERSATLGCAPHYLDFHDDLYAAISSSFRQPAFAGGTGGFFSALRAEPARYICHRPHIRSWLERLRANGVRVAIITNSHADFARFTMDRAFGAGAGAACDLIVANARKPGFFTSDAPLQTVAWAPHADTGIDESANGKPLAAPAFMPCADMLSGGSARALEALLGCSGEAILFVGDSCHGEIVPAHLCGWRTLAIVEEMQGGTFYEPAEWGGSFWSATPAGSEPFPGTTPAVRPQSWLGSAFQANAHSIVADINTLATGVGFSWQPHGGRRWL